MNRAKELIVIIEARHPQSDEWYADRSLANSRDNENPFMSLDNKKIKGLGTFHCSTVATPRCDYLFDGKSLCGFFYSVQIQTKKIISLLNFLDQVLEYLNEHDLCQEALIISAQELTPQQYGRLVTEEYIWKNGESRHHKGDKTQLQKDNCEVFNRYLKKH